jgi:predicted RNA-binding protein (virulence factor B family)
MARLGGMNELVIARKVDFGVYLDADELGDVLLPIRDVPPGAEPGDTLEVFLYRDSEDRLIATTAVPMAMAGRFAYLTVKAIVSFGAFLEWGLLKDLLVPHREQAKPMVMGRSYVVYVYVDPKSSRLAASSRIDRFLDKTEPTYEAGQAVGLLIVARSDLGIKAIVEHAHWGLIHNSDLFRNVEPGQSLRGFVKKMRDDSLIDLALQAPGYGSVGPVADALLAALEEEGGFLPVTDKTAPEEIYRRFGVSKKSYKKALGALYRARRIHIEADGLRLVTAE